MIGWIRRRRRERDLDEEIRTHLRMAVEERVARGELPDDAERAVRREFGKVGDVKDSVRRVWGGLWMDRLLQDLRYALRQLRRSPGFTAAAFTTIALSIGLTTGVFSLVNALLFSPLPGVRQPEELVAVHTDEGSGPGVSSYMDYRDLEGTVASFDRLAAFKARDVDVATAGGTVRRRGLMVSQNYFGTLGVTPAAGRFFLPAEDEVPGEQAVAVLSHGLWQSDFGGREEAIGATLVLNRRAFTIVGVTPAGFRGTNLLDAPDVYVPMAMQPHLMPSSGLLLDRRGWGGIDIVGRLADGVTPDQASAEIEVVGDRLRQAYPNTNGRRSYVTVSFRDATMPPGMRSDILGFGWVLIALVLLVLLIACVNVANLLLTRADARRREVAVRQSLGATRLRLMRQLLTEAGLLAVLGGAAGLALAYGLNGALAAIPLPLQLRFAVDRNVLLFCSIATLITGLAFGLAPAIGATRREAVAGLRDRLAGARGRRLSATESLVVLQVALSVAVLAAAGLFGRTLLNLRLIDPGFEPEGVLTARLDPSLQGYEGDRVKQFYEGVLDAVGDIPGVRAAALTSRLPGPDADGTSFSIQGYAPAEGQRLSMQFSIVSADYFTTLAIPARRGRLFGEADHENSPLAVILNESAARLVEGLTSADAVGARISIQGPDGPWIQVVGVAADVRSGPPREDPQPHMYFSFEQIPGGQGFTGMALLARGSDEPGGLAGAVRAATTAVDETVPLMAVRSLDAILGDGVAQERLAALVLAIAALLALMLASLGLYGVLAQAVARRRAEIGIRMALGAARASVVRGVLARGLGLTSAGLAVGIVLALISGRALVALLYGVSAQDATTLVVVGGVLLTVAGLASWIPAWRAVRIDPVTTLRMD